MSKRTDLAIADITVAPSPATSGTSLGISDAQAANFPTEYPYYALAYSDTANPTRSNAEIVKVTGGSSSAGTTTLTISRAQGTPATTAQSIATGWKLAHVLVADEFGYNNFIYDETPTGSVNGSNTAFSIANAPVAGTLMLYRDGQLLEGGGNDYTLSGTTITMVTAPSTGSKLRAFYQKTIATSGNADTLDGFNASYFFQLPQGHMLNGKIVPSVASNNLTVAIKTLADADPSASDPVYVRIGNTVRAITSALSVTKNAGTNWFASGGTEFATYERDYFVYIGYNATDGVVLGFSPICHAREYDDFSSTTTSETYAAISTITNVASGDDYELIGRFAATLSAGAGYTWSVPTFTNKNLIQHPIYETRWLSWLPSYTGFSAAPTNPMKYKLMGSTCLCAMNDAGTSNSATYDFTLPFTAPQQNAYGTRHEVMTVFDNSSWLGTSLIGIAVGGSASRTAKAGRTAASASANAFGGFTTSNVKGIFGSFSYDLKG